MLFDDMLNAAGLFSIALAALLTSLVPAFVIKLLMGAFFFITVRYSMVLLALVLSFIILWFSVGAYEFFSAVPYDTMTEIQFVLWFLGGLIFQALCLKAIATGPRMTMIAIWKWGIVLVLQYVVYALIGLLFVFIA